jgi:hypothetical protein
MKSILLWILVVIVVLVGIVVWRQTAHAPTAITQTQQNNFDQVGNMVRNNPGLVPGQWYLVYESAGAPAKTVQLIFNAESVCEGSRVLPACNTDMYAQGQRVRIQGNISSSSVEVRLLSEVQAL